MNLKPKTRTFLLLADISGYTHFMRESPLASSHARQIIVRLLTSLIHASAPPLIVVEVEGDAVFFYATALDEDLDRIASQVKHQILALTASFYAQTRELAAMNPCECDACSNVGSLKLKQILHVGDVTMEQVNQFERLFGVDVILVHKLLKNSVPSNDYVLMTEQAHSVIGNFHGLTPCVLREETEDFGIVNAVCFYPMEPIGELATSGARRPWTIEALAWNLRMECGNPLDRLSDHNITLMPSSARAG